MHTRRAPKGFTLIELMVAGTVAAIVLVGVCMTFIAETRLYQNTSGRSDAQASGRSAVTFMEDAIRRAGFGIDPDHAVIAYDAFEAQDGSATGTQALDYPDAISVFERDPVFTRSLVSLDSTGNTVSFSQSTTLAGGQILLLMSSDATRYEFVTVDPANPGGPIQYNLLPAGTGTEAPISAAGPRFRQQGTYPDSDFISPAGIAAKVDRFTFFLAAFADTHAAGAPLVPYLMVHRGLDTDGNTSVGLEDASPLAANVEQLQLAYVLDNQCVPAPAAGTQYIFGVNEASPPFGDAWFNANPPPPPTGTPPQPWWSTAAYTDPVRCADRPANLRQIRVTLVSRGRRDPQAPETVQNDLAQALADGTNAWRVLENYCLNAPCQAPAQFDPTQPGFQRTVQHLSIRPENLLGRSLFAPLIAGN